jgi:RNA polymerase-binding transcription factor DksA
MTHEALSRFRHRLLAERSALLERWRQALSDENELVEASEPDRQVLSCIDVHGRGALARIQSSLARIERDSYDECVACHGRITEERLRAVPDTDRCGRCGPRLN